MTDWLPALLTLTGLEIVLGIDNIVFIAILVGKLPKHRQASGRKLGLLMALLTRLMLLFSLTWIMRLTNPLFTVFDHGFSGRDLILLLGGLFLVGKATFEIHGKLEGEHEEQLLKGGKSTNFVSIIAQIAVIDIVFSLDSVITAVGMAQELWIMVTAVILSVGVMLLASGAISDFVTKHPTMKILALAFLILIGVTLMAESMGAHVAKGYIYTAMAFSFGVELLNIRYRKKTAPVRLH